MAFCRRCGNIVEGERCRCGGLAVAPVVSFNRSHTKEQSQDAWSKTYVSRERSPVRPTNHDAPPTTIASVTTMTSTSSSTQRFPRPLSSTYRPRSTTLDSRVSAHIASTSTVPSAPTRSMRSSLLSPESQTDILPSLHSNDATLSKVYGSVLQPKETLTTHSCAICSAPFLPDTTIYPDPLSPSTTHFLCRSCFLTSGGSKGACPTCSRPVVILKSEGGYVQAAGQYWHKQCFNCAGCFKNLGDNPMVDLFGRPSCAECFDTCLNRPSKSPAKDVALNPASNLGGLSVNSKDGKKSREGTPAMEELEQRLGISGSRDASPSVNTTAPRPSYSGGISPKNSPLTSPTYTRDTGIPIDRLSLHRDSFPAGRLSGHSASRANDRVNDKLSPAVGGDSFSWRPRSRSNDKLADLTNVSSTTFPNRTPAGPSLSDASNLAERGTLGHIKPLGDAFPLSSRATSPHIVNNSIRTSEPVKSPGVGFKQPSTPSTRRTFRLDQSAICAGCGVPLFSVRDGGKFITVPGENGEEPSVYHTSCFKCVICHGIFKEGGGAQAAFVRTERGPSHPDCATPQQATIRKSRSATAIHSTPSATPTRSLPTPTPTAAPPQSGSSRVERSSTTPIAVPFPRFGSRTCCPGCQRTVSPMEMGVVPGPQGTKWHACCLVCGGKRPTSGMLAKSREDVPGCGKRLDSAAKIDGDGGVWCRECLLLFGIGGSPQASPQRSSPPMQSGAILSRKPTTSMMGATTIVRQFNGFGSDNALLRQMTGGDTSPTKHLGIAGITRPRPKSITGVRSTTTSDNSGSRTYLMRHATGNSELAR